MNMVISLRWRDSEIVVGSRSEGSRDDLPDKVGCFSSDFLLALFILIIDVDDLGVDQLWCHSSLDKVLHDLA